ncbi:hypothetical protein [Nonomuraea gerenzanensis]|uniref:Secreted protein n=1 Tax=Nonomuraea gerenzanensis TaxID=93944 RepID=A0A1M4EA57_9ACTN|nr:hypothetical protein [Nonomuraea gerenzanensis]UBU17853.1 hypothetical protein LCN96_23360 [Nonomuraea gerenzanensis]SBO95642.1 hypothetical protein BN4615_P5158 [Nonomuraea gerenzanensis]
MRRITTTMSALGLAAITVAASLAAAPAAAADTAGTRVENCDAVWFSVPTENGQAHRDGKVRAFDQADCHTLLGADAGNDLDWGDDVGAFRLGDTNKASSLMNNGFTNEQLRYVAFYDYTYQDHRHGYGCLAPDELYADNLADDDLTTGPTINNKISSHQWVTKTACADNSWIE